MYQSFLLSNFNIERKQRDKIKVFELQEGGGKGTGLDKESWGMGERGMVDNGFVGLGPLKLQYLRDLGQA